MWNAPLLRIKHRGLKNNNLKKRLGKADLIKHWPASLFFPQMAILVGLRYLQTAMEGVLGQENVEIETEGYILEKGVKETLLETKEKMMKLLQFAQVGDASAETPGTEPEAEKPATA